MIGRRQTAPRQAPNPVSAKGKQASEQAAHPVSVKGKQAREQAPSLVKYNLQQIQIVGFPKGIGHLRKRYLTVRIDQGEVWRYRKLGIGEDGLAWKDPEDVKQFEALSTSKLELKLFEVPLVGDNGKEVGSCTQTIQSVLDSPAGGPWPLQVKKQKSTLELWITLEKDEPGIAKEDAAKEPELDKVVSDAKDALTAMHEGPDVPGLDKAVKTAQSASEKYKSGSDTWQPLIDKLDGFMKLMDGVSEIHPYAKMAWSVISAAYKIYKNQKDRDEKVNDLADMMNEAYETIMAGTTLRELVNRKGQAPSEEIKQADRRHMDVLQRLSIQTVECGQFIAKYAKDGNFFMRAGKQILGNPTTIIDRFVETFEKLLLAFEQQAVVSTEIMVVRVLQTVQKIEMTTDLTGLTSVYVKGAGYNTAKQCLAGTRTVVLDGLSAWINSTNDRTPKVRLLLGQAGTGKSTIAHTIASRFRAMKRLGAAFCSSSSTAQHSKHVLATLALDLASFDASFKAALWSGVGQDLADQTTDDLERQFEKFILQPAQEVAIIGSVFILLDGLDEIGDVRTREPLLRVLSEQLQKLPPGFRILLTARPEPDIVSFFEPGSGYIIQHINTTPNDQTLKNDILLFVRTELTKVRPRIEDLDESNYMRLAEMAEGLFQWARVACDYIAGDGRLRKRPKKRYEDLLRNSEQVQKQGKTVNLLDNLYLLVLPRLISTDDDDEEEPLETFKLAVGLVLTAFVPLDMDALDALAGHVKGLAPDDMGYLLPHLGSFLSGVSERKVDVRPLHSSFRDFLSSSSRSKNFYIGDATIHHANLAIACIHVLNSELHFNMCKLATSYRLNRDVPDLDKIIRDYISSELSYASRFWAQHINPESGLTTELKTGVHKLLDTNFPFWMEVLSVLGVLNSAAWGLSSVIPIIQMSYPELADLATDGLQFVRNLARPMAESAPHIYVSALVNCPRNSLLGEYYAARYSKLVQICKGQWETWPELHNILSGHSDRVNEVAFSPDGKRIVSGSDDNTVRLWDAETGEPFGVPLVGHSAQVQSVAFSPGGKRIASASEDKTVRMWDSQTGDPVGAPLVGHKDRVRTVVFSPDGKQIVSGSDDRTIRMWDSETFKPIGSPLKGHREPIKSIAFSPDGSRIVSGSDDGTVRIWDVVTGQPVGVPMVGKSDFLGHLPPMSDSDESDSDGSDSDGEDSANSTADGNESEGSESDGSGLDGSDADDSDASGSESFPISVNSVVFSPDGKHIVAGSDDCIIRIWDAGTCELVGVPLEGHNYYVCCVAFSPDGRRIVSSAGDSTIRVWDADTGQPISTLLEGHRDLFPVNSVAFSPDGRRIVSGEGDGTARIWNAEPSNPVDAVLHEHIGSGILCAVVSPDGKQIICSSRNSVVQVWDAELGKPVGSPLESHSEWVHCIAFSPDGQQLACGGNEGYIQLRDVATGEPAGIVLEGHSNSFRRPKYSPDDKGSAHGSDDDSLDNSLDGPIESVRSLKYSADGKRIVAGGDDGTLRIWDAKTGQLLSARPVGLNTSGSSLSIGSDEDGSDANGSDEDGSDDDGSDEDDSDEDDSDEDRTSVNSVAISPDSTRIVSGSSDHIIRIWDVETGDPIGSPLKGHNNSVNIVEFSPDGKRIISASDDKTIRIWDAQTGDLVGAPLEGHNDSIRCMAISPDGKRIVSGSDDTTVRMWDAETGQRVGALLDAHTEWVTCVAFSPDGKWIMSGSDDNTIRIWDVDTCERLKPELPVHGQTNDIIASVVSQDKEGGITISSKEGSVAFPSKEDPTSGNALHRIEDHSLIQAYVLTDHGPLRICYNLKTGWITCNESDYLFWLPPESLRYLCTAGCRLVFPSSRMVTLDMSRFVHGAEWAKCYRSSR